MNKPCQNIAASVRQRLLNISRDTNQQYNVLLVRYAVERLLFRLSVSQHAPRFVLKGAILFTVWLPAPHRITKDLDLLGFGSCEIGDLVQVFREICTLEVPDDGISFDVESVSGEPIRAEEFYVGVRILLQAFIGTAKLNLQVDIGFGDGFTVKPVEVSFPSLLDMPAPKLRAYRMETSIAEKFSAMLDRGLLNSRMKDYFDIWYLANNFPFQGAELASSIGSTCHKRGHSLPAVPPEGLSDEFWNDDRRQTMWKAFWNKNVRRDPFVSLQDIVVFNRSFLLSAMLHAATGKEYTSSWKPGGPWEDQ